MVRRLVDAHRYVSGGSRFHDVYMLRVRSSVCDYMRQAMSIEMETTTCVGSLRGRLMACNAIV